MLEDFGALVVRQILQDRHRVVGIELAHAYGDGGGGELFENFLAYGIVDFGERGEIEVPAEQRDQPRA